MSKSDLIISRPEKRTHEQLKRLQNLPLQQKVNLSKRRIKQFHDELDGMIYVALSGGKDSTVLVDIVRSMYPETKSAFCNTGLEYPEIVSFVKTFKNVDWLKPKMSFVKVIEKYGYPVPSKEVSQKIEEIRNTKSEKLKNKRLYGDEKGNGKLPLTWQCLIDAPFKISGKCCNIMKKEPSKRYEKETGLNPIVGTMASESRLRESTWLEHGCNMFDSNRPKSTPLSFWTDADIWEYIKTNNIEYSKIYDMGETRTGCMFCLFGCQFDRSKFDRMKINHPKQYKACENLGVIDVLHYLDKKLGRDQKEFDFEEKEIIFDKKQ